MNRYQLDGRRIRDIESLCAAFAEAVDAPNGYFGKDFQSFDDCLFGGYGLEAPCEVVWMHHEASRAVMDCRMLADWCRATETPYAEGRKWVEDALARAERGELSLFDLIAKTISSVKERSGGNVQLKLILS